MPSNENFLTFLQSPPPVSSSFDGFPSMRQNSIANDSSDRARAQSRIRCACCRDSHVRLQTEIPGDRWRNLTGQKFSIVAERIRWRLRSVFADAQTKKLIDNWKKWHRSGFCARRISRTLGGRFQTCWNYVAADRTGRTNAIIGLKIDAHIR